MGNDVETAVSLLRQGQPPGNDQLIKELSVGIQFITDFWCEKYLAEYIALGGSKIKFVTGGSGSGKTHLLQLFSLYASEANYVTVHFSAKDVWLHDFKAIYGEIFQKSDLIKCLQSCANQIVSSLGYDPSQIQEGQMFVDYLSDRGELDPIIKREIRIQLQDMFLSNPLIDNNFALACSLLTGGVLGHPALEKQNQDMLLLWLTGSREANLPALRRLGLSPYRITKFNARHMLRSLTEVCRMAGYTGIVVTIDNLEILVGSDTFDDIRYTRLKREDAYESMRELIDEIDTLKNIMFVFAFDRDLIDDDLSGLKSYQALWMRIQNEIVSEKFNRFTDIVDLDRLMEQVFTVDTILEMSQKLAETMNAFHDNMAAVDRNQAEEILSRMQFGKTSLPRLVNMATLYAIPKAGEQHTGCPAPESGEVE